jgi:hypothetical protein
MVFLAGSIPARATINFMLMSRSFKKHPFMAVACYFSNKEDKILANRLFRRISKKKLKQGEEPLHSLKEVSDTWNFDSDGLAYYHPKEYYNHLLELGYTQEYIDELYRKQMSK